MYRRSNSIKNETNPIYVLNDVRKNVALDETTTTKI